MTEHRTPKVRAYGQGLTRHLIIRCSDEQLERWRVAADRSGVGMGLSEWIREKLDKAASTEREVPEKTTERSECPEPDNTLDGLLRRMRGKE